MDHTLNTTQSDAELVERMAQASFLARQPVGSWGELNKCSRSQLLLEASAALAVAKPAIERAALVRAMNAVVWSAEAYHTIRALIPSEQEAK